DPVEAFGADATDPALGVGVRVRRLRWRADRLDVLAAEDLVEGVAELAVAIVDQEPERLLVAELHDEVPRLLRGPAAVRIRGAGDVLDPPRRERDEEEHVDPRQVDGTDREEVAGEHAPRLRAQKRAPRGMRPLWSRWQPCIEQHLAYRGRGDADAGS